MFAQGKNRQNCQKYFRHFFRETKDTVRVSLQEYLFTGSWILAEKSTVIAPLGGGFNSTQGTTLTVYLVLPTFRAAPISGPFWGALMFRCQVDP